MRGKKGMIFMSSIFAILVIGVFFVFKINRGEKYEKVENAKPMSVNEILAEKNMESQDYIENEVICESASEEEAEKIATLVDGQLKSFQNGYAVIEIKETVEEFLLKNKKRTDIPKMQPNYIYSTK